MTPAAHPPFWAEPLLGTLLPPDRVDDVMGDLVEACREQPRRAVSTHLWWARYVGGLFLRTYWLFPLVLVAMLIVGDILNTFRDVHGGDGPLHGLPIFTIYGAAGLLGGYRTRRMVGGLVAAVGSHLAGWTGITLWWAITTYPFALSQQHHPYWINAWQGSAAPGESFMHWIVWDNVGAVLLGGSALLLLSLALGLAGGIIGSRVGRRRGVARA
jgi:hypothetical protein